MAQKAFPAIEITSSFVKLYWKLFAKFTAPFMRLKSFHGTSLTEAMRLVRDALGENAIIVATRDDDLGGVRVTAAIDEPPPAHPAAAATIGTSHTSMAVEAEGTESIETIAEALTRHQVPRVLAEKLMASATQFANDDPVLALGAAFDTHFKFNPIVDDRPGKPLILIGPPGAGKTLSIAKFATKIAVLRKAVTVVSTDFERAGGIEQLAAFTRLLNLNLVEIEDSHALRELVAMQNGSYIFIDTPGGNPFDDVERLQLQALVTAAGGEAGLVLPAGLDAAEAADMAKAFQSIGATRLLLTRLDMTRRLGSALGIAYGAGLPLANYGATSKAAEPLQPLNPIALARLLLHGTEASTAKRELTAAKSGR
ncbi:MAG: GTPase [Pseudomonadota bacterium]|nr:GTPase [Pseudomonadota bacterium]